MKNNNVKSSHRDNKHSEPEYIDHFQLHRMVPLGRDLRYALMLKLPNFTVGTRRYVRRRHIVMVINWALSNGIDLADWVRGRLGDIGPDLKADIYE